MMLMSIDVRSGSRPATSTITTARADAYRYHQIRSVAVQDQEAMMSDERYLRDMRLYSSYLRTAVVDSRAAK